MLGQIIIGVWNDLRLEGKISSFSNIIIAGLFINIILVPIALIFWFLMKFIFKIIGKSEVLEGANAQRNVLIIWLLLFLALCLWRVFFA